MSEIGRALTLLAAIALAEPGAADEIPQLPVPSIHQRDEMLTAPEEVWDRAALETCPAKVDDGPGPGRTPEGLTLDITVEPATVAAGGRGRPATIRVTLANASDRPLFLTFPDTGIVSYRVQRPDGALVLTPESPVVTHSTVTRVRLRPGQTMTSETTWSGRLLPDEPAAPGRYTFTGTLEARSCGPLQLPLAVSRSVPVDVLDGAR